MVVLKSVKLCYKMQEKFTVRGTLIPQDPDGKDMCVLFLKFGRCRFKQKCKKSHWVPPLPEEPYPDEVKPPLPVDNVIEEGLKRSCQDSPSSDTLSVKSGLKISVEKCSNQLHHSSLTFNKTFCNIKDKMTHTPQVTKSISQNDDVTTNMRSHGIHACRTNSKRKITDSESDSQLLKAKKRKQLLVPRRFKHIFQDNCHEAMQYSSTEKMFPKGGVYFDKVTQKVKMVHSQRNKIKKRQLKTLRRLHWQTLQTLKEKLAQYPPSYSLKFDRNKINFTRLAPYIYILVHECLCSGGANKPAKPSSLHYLIADTLIVYLDIKRVTAPDAENKLRQWGARTVRARQCVDHLWHVLAISSKSPEGCANEVIDIEQEVIAQTRTALDYAHACSFALRKAKFGTKMTNDKPARKVNSSLKQGLEATKRNLLMNKNQNVCRRGKTYIGFEMEDERFRETTDHAKQNVKNIKKKRKRSKQFKKVSLNERKKIKNRCVGLLSTFIDEAKRIEPEEHTK